MNKVVLIGRMVRDPEMKFIQNSDKAVTNFTLAVDRKFKNKDGQKEADFINCVAYGKTAEVISNYLAKGRMVAVSGRIQTRTYEGNDGQKRYVTEAVIDDVQFLEKKDSGASTANKPADGNGFADNDFFPADGDTDIPF
jgi:single-strand DNA-binding protein